MPSEKRARQRAARDLKKAAEAKRVRRKKLLRNSLIVGGLAVVVVGSVLLINQPWSHSSATTTTTSAKSSTTTSSSTTTTAATAEDAAAQKAADAAATAAGCPADPKTRVNTLTWSSPPAMTIDTSKTYTATVKTTAGTFTITLDAKQAPETVNSFVFLANQNYFHCVTFHRVVPGFMDQTGDPTGTGSGGPGYQFANENLPQKYATGDVAMANSGANTNGSQFFVIVPGGATQLKPTYSLFGHVTKGMTVVEKINSEGNPTTNGVPPKVTQRILSVTVHTT
ncbi:MAG TPA: peptidylprolyl isomerase [Acidimicrobiales bacterium]|nr:peptidylprolyl isomerase [Acidimicrobiales bacterium]